VVEARLDEDDRADQRLRQAVTLGGRLDGIRYRGEVVLGSLDFLDLLHRLRPRDDALGLRGPRGAHCEQHDQAECGAHRRQAQQPLRPLPVRNRGSWR